MDSPSPDVEIKSLGSSFSGGVKSPVSSFAEDGAGRPSQASPSEDDTSVEDGSLAPKEASAPVVQTTAVKPEGEVMIFCLGMARTGTASVAEALNVLGIRKVHHGLKNVMENWQWEILLEAANASFPTLKTYTGQPFTREQWDKLWGEYEVGTDMASFFARSLIHAYPEAKIILVERDIERWHRSVRVIFDQWVNPFQMRYTRTLSRLAGSKAAEANFKMSMGWTESKSHRHILRNARAAYNEHYKWIRENVPADQLLDYKLSEGWGPLAKFLGKPVPGPEVPFPHVNDTAHFEEEKKRFKKIFLWRIFFRFMPCFRCFQREMQADVENQIAVVENQTAEAEKQTAEGKNQ